ncbi:hypothetical protein THAOC_26557 [Thalassiosira oceanica]|uniref:Uncharacterized protein n=1 Tax=Thalassiosira oceanica TaxID=159749 RepID=K0RNR3_THAOC|nr:hypothetical protein THAOC_26557 [Thalassiosira oceanica]|eukprot:EJK53914.1 hypothetical protein THAOC_26557 [Thalassiosira oceanica]
MRALRVASVHPTRNATCRLVHLLGRGSRRDKEVEAQEQASRARSRLPLSGKEAVQGPSRGRGGSVSAHPSISGAEIVLFHVTTTRSRDPIGIQADLTPRTLRDAAEEFRSGEKESRPNTSATPRGGEGHGDEKQEKGERQAMAAAAAPAGGRTLALAVRPRRALPRHALRVLGGGARDADAPGGRPVGRGEEWDRE